jgi:adenylosuccinate synthase
MEYVDIVLGCSFGDEGKGKVVFDLLNNNYNLCVRFNGSGNAGHTIYLNDKKFVVHQLPVGILKSNVYNLISSDCLIHIEKLKKELNELKELNIDPCGRLFISKACHIITEEAIEYDKQNNKIGTTGSGIGYTYAQKMLRTGKRVEDCAEEIESLGIQVVDMRTFWNTDFVKTYVRRVLLEGAQGFELDINWTNNYPYCTSSTCSLAGAINTGIPLKKIRNIYGISKIYDTYVGNMKFEPDNDNDLIRIGELGHEFGATTGRKRQCNYLNLDNLINALEINQCNICIINKVDIVEQLKIFKLYHNGHLMKFKNIDDFKSYILNQSGFLNRKIIFSSNPYSIL